ncbi:MAG TPA: metal-dependent transcriptional regulator [Solirubrobacteraceae bacterium]|jgi:DtxR family Mn-dependent transcriptional regulator|nr:metal-dependent transcriptional regulator [Solirubrobacteraceae bacterium]
MNPPVSAPVEDYVKAIYSLTLQPEQTASTSQIADRLGITAGSVSTMVKRMGVSGLVEHVPYRGVRLTPTGRQLALAVIRRHRLLELFLSTSLDIPWEDVHRFADALEHAASDELIELIAAKLGDPVADPHGDPIPNRLLEVDDSTQPSIADLHPGERARIVRVSDAEPEMLRYLTQQCIGIGDEVELVARQPFDGPCDVRLREQTRSLGLKLAQAIHVQRL